MSFDTIDGTRGARQPKASRFYLWLNRQAANRFRRKGGRAFGMNALVLITIGRKSGAERSTPVGWFAGPEDSWLIVASAAGGPKNPAWYHNLAASPDQAYVELGGSRIPVRAEQLRGAERDQAWQRITAESPRFTQYQEGTDRELPVIRLTRRAE